MITILSAKQMTVNNESWVTVEVDIDGRRVSVGRIDPKMNKSEILEYLDKNKVEILADIEKSILPELVDRVDLYVVRNLAKEIDDLIQAVATQATKISEIEGKIANK